MDVYHKVLVKLVEETGGRDSVKVDFSELLKKEGFLPSIDSISDYMRAEGWITDAGRKNVIQLTHWGLAEAKKTMKGGPDKNQALTKASNKLLAETRELQIMMEEFVSDPSSDKFKQIEKTFQGMGQSVNEIKSNL